MINIMKQSVCESSGRGGITFSTDSIQKHAKLRERSLCVSLYYI